MSRAVDDPPTQPVRTLGLSGDVERVLGAAPELRFFDRFLRRYESLEDLVADPTPLWDGPGRTGAPVGLRAHLVADPELGPGAISDVLLIVNRKDWARARERREGRWIKLARGLLSERLLAYCIASGLPTGAAGRDLGVHVVGEGGEATGGELLGLGPGEFVTALLPNHHLGPRAGHPAEFGVHLHIPGQWPGYREVARLYPGQALLTLGNHWLDNFRHPALRVPALYVLRRGEDGGLVHEVNPDLSDRFRVRTGETAAGQPVVTVEGRTGRAVAFLAVAPVAGAPHAPIGALGDVTLQTVDPVGSPSVPPDALTPARTAGRRFTLVEQGALLQRVHFRSVMVGYDVLVGRRGEVGNAVADPVARLRVDAAGVTLVVCASGVSVDGEPRAAGAQLPLTGDHELLVGATALSYRDLSAVQAEGWPYLAELRRLGASVHTRFGDRFRIGRHPRCRVRLPDDRRNDNILWRDQVGDDEAIRSRHGALSKERFYTDSILVASEHAEVDLTGEPVVYGIARSCWTFVRRGHDVLSLPPTRKSDGDANADLLPGDELLVGNCVFEVRYPPAEAARPPGELPRDRGPLSARELAAAADELEPDPVASRRLPKVEKLPLADEAPVAAGLGERGPVPPRPPLGSLDSVDSLLDEVLEPTAKPLAPVGVVQRCVRDRHAATAPIEDGSSVVTVDETTLQVELSRSARLVLVGWRRGGELRIGNHGEAHAVVPEIVDGGRSAAPPRDLARLTADGGALVVEPRVAGGLRVRVGRAGEAVLEADRIGADGEVDVVIRMTATASPGGELSVDLHLTDRFARGLFTLGLPLRTDHLLQLGRHAATAHFDGQVLRVSFVEPPRGVAPTRMLSPGDKLLVGAAVYRFERD